MNWEKFCETTFAKSLLRYWLAMNASALDAAVNALYTFCGVAGVHQAGEAVPALNVPALNLSQLGVVFCIAFGGGILSYLKLHPLENLLPTIPRLVTSAPTEPKPETANAPTT